MADLRERPTIGMSFEEEAKLFEEEACAEFAKETGCSDAEGVNNILRRGMRIIRKAREEIARRSLRPKGEWDATGRYKFADGSIAIRCNICGAALHSAEWEQYHWNFCPNCGADMRGEDDA